jgi:hypothetical protein
MDFDAASHADNGRPTGRLVRLMAAAGLTAVIAAGLLASGAGNYVTAAFGAPPGHSSADTQYRPGWGCGDRNHVHTGPPGRQYAPPPPGCR